MPAEIKHRDIQAGTEMAWHGQTRVVEKVTFEEAFPFEIERRPLLMANDTPLEGWSYFHCSDDNAIAGVPVPDTYSAITNARFWEIVNNALGGSGAIVESAGTLMDRTRRFATVRLGIDLDEFNVGGRTFKNRLTLLDSIDQSTMLCGINTSVCVVCANTFRLAMSDKSGEFRFQLRHTKNLAPKIENMEKAIDAFCGVTGQFQQALATASEIPVTVEDARALFAGWITGSERGISTRSYNVVGRLTELFKAGAGNRGETLLDAFSAVTDYYSHESSGGSDQPNFRLKQSLSSEYGSAAAKKQDFYWRLFSTPKRVKDGPAYPPLEFNRSGFDGLVSQGRIILTAADVVMGASE